MVVSDMFGGVKELVSASVAGTAAPQSGGKSVGDTLSDTIDESLKELVAYFPEIVVALVFLGAGYVIGTRLGPFVTRLVYRFGVDSTLQGTWVGETIQEPRSDGGVNPSESPQNQAATRQPPAPRYGPVANAAGEAVKYYVILFAAFLAADRLGVSELSQWIEGIIDYAPGFVAGAAVIIIGLVFAEYAARQTGNSELTDRSEYGVWITSLVRGVLSAVVLIIGLEMFGFEIEIVYIITEGIVSTIGVGLTFAIAVALGVAGGLAAKDYYEENMA
ncbi:hypothetical protein ACFQJ7_15755 [Halovenus rubra]|uniref:Uncharacterized protein n=2 Tax=Halovenus rubra TaxID=869890 RepID=A0ACC7E0I6_9EURY|nr:hypothetical protein [Halovenus rubra]